MKYLKIIILGLLVSFFCTLYIMKSYSTNKTIKLNDSEKIYFFQYGAYKNIDSMKKNTLNLENYVYELKEDLYHVYIGITKDKKNIKKIKGFFEDLGYSIYVKEAYTSDDNLIKILDEYDMLINNTEDKTSIKIIQNKLLESYR